MLLLLSKKRAKFEKNPHIKANKGKKFRVLRGLSETKTGFPGNFFIVVFKTPIDSR